jgi:hypothetical protein
MIKKLFNLTLMAALLGGLSLSVTSCKDDNNDNGNSPESEQSEVEGLSALADDQLQNLLERWTDADEDSFALADWREKKYAATVGMVFDEADPFTRSVIVGSSDAADQYAIDCLGTLGINADQPDGFTFTDDQVGTVSYQRSGLSNTLGVINVEIQQIKGLQRIQLLRDMPDNAPGVPYYSLGDIIQYKDRYYVCASKHKATEEARFVTINDKHSTGTCRWFGYGKDTVYNDDMASAEALCDWLVNIVIDKNGYDLVEQHMDATDNDRWIGEVIPQSDKARATLMSELCNDIKYLTDLLGIDGVVSDRWNADGYIWEEEDDQHYLMAPLGYLLANKMRWTLTGKYWVPYVYMIPVDQASNYEANLNARPSQSTLSPRHFKWKRLAKDVEIKAEDALVKQPTYTGVNHVKATKYNIYLLAMYWTHDTYEIAHDPTVLLWNFTKNWANHPVEEKRNVFSQNIDDLTNACITSSSITFTDNGKKQKKYDDVYILRNRQ